MTLKPPFFCKIGNLGGGLFQIIFYSHPETWGNDVKFDGSHIFC